MLLSNIVNKYYSTYTHFKLDFLFHLRSVFQTEDLIHKYNAAGKPVAAILVEPIQAEGGDNHASPEFFQGLQQIGKRVSVVKIYI